MPGLDGVSLLGGRLTNWDISECLVMLTGAISVYLIDQLQIVDYFIFLTIQGNVVLGWSSRRVT